MGRGESKTGGTAGIGVAQRKELNRIANRTRNLKNEQMRVVDTDGNVVLTKKGGRVG